MSFLTNFFTTDLYNWMILLGDTLGIFIAYEYATQ